MKNFKTILSLLFLAVVAIILIANTTMIVKGAIYWDNGVCPKCNTEYETSTYLLRGTSWIKYHCENCNISYSIPESATD